MDLTYSVDLLRGELTRAKQTMFTQIGKFINFDVDPQVQSQSRIIQTEEDLHNEVII